MRKLLTILILSGTIFMACTKPKSKSQSSSKIPSVNSVTSTTTKNVANNNPLLANVFCADPTAVEYDGRLYVYGTNDHQMYKKLKSNEDVNYGYINTLVIMSSDDMVNWTYHGEVEVSKAATWAGNSWAPSIVARKEDDGLTHFYLYFANGGNGIGVLTSTSPVGPWTDPIKKPLIGRDNPTLGQCNWLFDPGAVIDDNGDGWITFGGSGDPNSVKIAKLGKDMISLASDIVTVPQIIDQFEANELNYINGTYVWSYCTKWEGLQKSSVAAIAYATSKTPLDATSWEYKGDYFLNQSKFGLGGGNNHSHLQKFQGNYYLIYQAHDLHSLMGVKGDCRNINIDKVTVDEKNVKIESVKGTKKGVDQIKTVPATVENQFAMMANGADFAFKKTGTLGKMTVAAAIMEQGVGAWTLVKGIQFDSDASKVVVKSKGTGTVKVCIDSRDIDKAADVKIDSADFAEVTAEISVPSGKHDVYFVFTNNMELDSWRFE